MIRKRNIGTVAAIGGLTAAIALLTGLPNARADESTDLRANQELLQHRVDQLAQGIVGAGGLYPSGPRAASAGQGLLGGSFPRSFLIPGTDTSMRVGGNIYMDVLTFFSGGNPNVNPQTNNTSNNGNVQVIPLYGTLDRSRGNGTFNFTPNRTNINFETRTPTDMGEAKTFLEWDFSSNSFAGADVHNTNNLGLRLRYAYGSLGGFLAGQANSNFADPDASMTTLSFGGITGDPGPSRVPQIRYTVPLAPWSLPGAFSVSAEAPETDGQSLAGVLNSDTGAATTKTITASTTTCTSATVNSGGAADVDTTTTTCTIPGNLPAFNPFKTKAPDLTAAWYIPQPWGHADFSAVLRPDLAVNDGLFVRRDFIGWGAHVGMDIKPFWFGWEKDDITLQVEGGDGIGRYQSGNTTFFSLASNYPNITPTAGSTAGGSVGTRAAAAAIKVSTTRAFGGNLGYLHWWTPTIRSNIGFGMIHNDIPAFVGAAQRGALNKQLMTGAANIIWSPVSFIDFGLEYMYGYRVVVSKANGDAHSLQGQMRVKF